jgi:hypothetical protein
MVIFAIEIDGVCERCLKLVTANVRKQAGTVHTDTSD